MRNHPNKFQAKIQSLGSSVFGSKFSGQNGVLVGLEFSDKFTFQSSFDPLEWFYVFKPLIQSWSLLKNEKFQPLKSKIGQYLRSQRGAKLV